MKTAKAEMVRQDTFFSQVVEGSRELRIQSGNEIKKFIFIHIALECNVPVFIMFS